MTNARAVVVTGVSTGIGWGTTQALVAAGFHVFGSVRRSEDGARAQQAFGDSFTPLLFDVTDGPAVLAAAQQVRQALAGQASFGPLSTMLSHLI